MDIETISNSSVSDNFTSSDSETDLEGSLKISDDVVSKTELESKCKGVSVRTQSEIIKKGKNY